MSDCCHLGSCDRVRAALEWLLEASAPYAPYADPPAEDAARNRARFAEARAEALCALGDS